MAKKTTSGIVVGKKRRISGRSDTTNDETDRSTDANDIEKDSTDMKQKTKSIDNTDHKDIKIEKKRKHSGNVDSIQNDTDVNDSIDEDDVDDDDDHEMENVDDEQDAEDDVVSNDEDDDDTPKEPSEIQPILLHGNDGKYRNKQRCLTLCSRNVTARYRHLLEDLRTLIPHHKKETKLDNGTNENIGSAVQQIAEVRGCNTVLFLECRKHQDAYLWLGRTGFHNASSTVPISSSSLIRGGPCVKFYVTNIHTMDELKLTGNCMKHSRPILSFDESFNRLGHLKLIKELFVDIFTTPRGHPKCKPFIDRIMSFYYADNRIWVRHYQIVEQKADTASEAHKLKKQLGVNESTSLVEIGPRFVLEPIKIFRGSFGGQTLYNNTKFTSPNVVRAAAKQNAGNTFAQRQATQILRKERNASIVVPTDPLDTVFKK